MDLEFITPYPNALEPQFGSNDIVQGDFLFQEHITLAYIPIWLSQESFTSMLCEGSRDVEAKFFVPGCGFTKELLKVEDRIIHPSKFWSEIRRFQEIDAGSPGTYRRFIVVATGISRDLEPLVNELRRVRNYQDFSQENFTIKDNSFRDYIQIITGIKGTDQDAFFIFNKVIIDIDWNNVKNHSEAIFKQYLVDNLPEDDELSNNILDTIYNHIVKFIRSRKNHNITRKEIETKLRDKIPSNQQPPLRPILIYTATEPKDNPDHPGLHFDWASFSGGETRAIAPPQEWNRLLIELQKTRSWIEKYRNTKRIRLAGNRRLIPCLAIGSVFSAVRGYSIEMEHREEVWPTDAHPTHETPDYPLSHQIVGETGTRLVVSMSIGIRRDITSEVEANLEKYELTGTPLLHIKAEQPITSPQQINVAVGNIKKLIVDNLVRIGGKEIHLFFAGPAHLALFLGHRLDATAPITCYAWVATGQYSKTLQLFSGITK
ncbi:SAVED domain-containing protein [Brasilonema sp. CT11]|nr:SAVED domain-containing protein [Brasilonema sp. CT11]